jgi:MFS family permease
MIIRINIDVKVGKLVKFFILSDLLLLAGWGLMEPVFSIFIVERVAGATLVTVGIAAAIYWLVKSVLQIPIAKYLDKTPGEKDDLYTLIFGLIIAAFAAMSFALVTKIWELYVVQLIHAVGFAFYAAAWPAIFSRHLDKDRISFDWALDSTAVGIAAGASGFLSGLMATWLGFKSVFVCAAIFSLASALILLLTPDLILPKPAPADEVVRKDHNPGTIHH